MKLSKRQRRAAIKAPNWVRAIAATKNKRPKSTHLDAADRFLLAAKKRERK